MSNAFSSALFCARNVNKVENGEYGRVPVFIGQGKNVINSIMELDNYIGKGAKTAVDAFNKVCKNDPVLKYVGKGAQLASEHVNSLICLSAGIKVATADDKLSAGIEQTAALGAMFTAESLMKKHMDELPKIKPFLAKQLEKAPGLKKYTDIALKKAAPLFEKLATYKALPAAVKGIAFVAGSATAFMVGEKVGKMITGNDKPKKLEQLA